MSNEARYLSIVSGRSRGFGATAARAGLAALEPLYRGIVRTRNTLFDTNIKSAHDLGRPTVSIGNITTGGTGKTPVVQWLAAAWLARGGHPAILLRGYRSHNGISDEAELLRAPGIEVEPNPDRIAGAASVLARTPETDLFILDDGFQHRRAKRDLDIVLIDATNPFGHGHVLPRGLLREPVSSLSRAHAILITRASAAGDALGDLKQQIRTHAPRAEIFVSDHALAGLLDASDQPVQPDQTGRCVAVAGIGNPEAFAESLRQRGLSVVDTYSPGDHHVYTDADLKRLREWPNIDTIITTEKDWVKIKRLPPATTLPILRAGLRIDFADGDAERLLKLVQTRMKK
jgi:tetraacyldisaccharide 4'-kinase